MEAMENYNRRFIISPDQVIEEEDNLDSAIFSQLKQHCLQLLNLLQNPNKIKDHSFIYTLHQLLQRSSSQSLRNLYDYTLFPLLLIFDAAVNHRSSKSPKLNAVETSHEISDSVAEGVILCLEEVLKKCHLRSIDQMIGIMKKLTYGILLSPSEASEEFREGVIRCFKALLLNICPCSNESCPCKKIGDCPNLLAEKETQFPVARIFKYDSVPEECIIAFLQSEDASAAIGHWLSLLLKAADTEATRGQRGSSRIRIEALITLRVLVSKVGTAEALAFFLPGVVSQISKVLHVSRTMISGAAGSAEALNHAIRGLAEYLTIVLDDGGSTSNHGVPDLSKEKPLALLLEELRHLPVKNQVHEQIVKDSAECMERSISVSCGKNTRVDGNTKVGPMRVERNSEWFANTTARVNKLLSATYPHLCVHPSKKVRLGLLASVQSILCKCSYTLKESRLMLLECLFVLVCDDSEEVSSTAIAAFGLLVSSRGKDQVEHDIAEIFSRLVEELPRLMLSSEESVALSHAQKLLAVTYFCGPRLIGDYLLRSPVAAARFLDVFAVSFSQNSAFTGSLNKLVSARPSSSGFMQSIFEIKAIANAHTEDTEFSGFQNRKALSPYEHLHNYQLPSMPPWFVNVGSQKMYKALAAILRLVSLYIFSDSRSEGSLSMLIDILLGHLRKLIFELRAKEYYKDSWQSWYKRTGSGHLVRQACTAVCILNEMMFGLSDQAVATFKQMFKSSRGQEIMEFQGDVNISCGHESPAPEIYLQKINENARSRAHLIDCIGSVLHEYLSPEIWDLPLGLSTSHLSEDGDVNLHFFSDNGMLHQVIIEGIGIFNICLGKEFSSGGFLHNSLYMLLENVICSNFQVRRASDAVLQAISATHDHPTVGHLVIANSDYIIDSVCRQLRHLDLNPHVPNVLSTMLSYVGVADKILPLLEEPMRAVSMELEILGRHQHPNLTVPFLKAVAEIAKASKHEACKLPNQAESYKKDINFRLCNTEKRTGKHFDHSSSHVEDTVDIEEIESEIDEGICSYDANIEEHELETILFRLKDSKRYRKIVGSIAESCLVSVTPLIASADPAACLTALDIVEACIMVLAKVEEAYKHENETKETIQEFILSCSFHNLLDTLETSESEAGENRLLPAINKIWPFLVACFRNTNQITIRRCSQTISTIVQIGGGDFFARRLQSDGAHIWKVLNTSPFGKKPLRKEERTPLQLPYRKSSTSNEDPMAEISNIKVQVAVLDMISDIAKNKRSASALDAVFKKVSGIAVGIACSGVKGLQDSSINALVGLASIDPDLIWVLLADVYYSIKKDDHFRPPSDEFPEINEVLPRPSSSKEYLYVLYGGQSYGFDIDFKAVETVFKKLHSLVFTSQMYI